MRGALGNGTKTRNQKRHRQRAYEAERKNKKPRPAMFRCRCGKAAFMTRQDARRFGRTKLPGYDIHVYACAENLAEVVYHFTTMPARLVKLHRDGAIRSTRQEGLAWLRSRASAHPSPVPHRRTSALHTAIRTEPLNMDEALSAGTH